MNVCRPAFPIARKPQAHFARDTTYPDFSGSNVSIEEDRHETASIGKVVRRVGAGCAAGLARLKRHFVIGTLSNGNMSLLIDLARAGSLPWDVILSGELFRHYKPDPQVYVGAAALLGLPPKAVMLVAAHKDDLAAARRCGLQTAYVRRPLEHGRESEADVSADRRSDFNADDFVDLARQLRTKSEVPKIKERISDLVH